MDFLPLARFLWYDASSPCKLTFAHTGRTLSVHGADAGETEEQHYAKADTFNNILLALTSHDVLNIKRYGRKSRLVQALYVMPLDGYANLVYGLSSIGSTHVQRLNIADEGRTLEFQDEARMGCGLFRLSWALLRRILDLTASSHGGVTFDLDNHTVCGLSMNILQVNKRLREICLATRAIAENNSVTLRATARELVTSFKNFSALEELSLNTTDE